MLKSALLTLALAASSLFAMAQVTVVDVENGPNEPAQLKPTTGTNGLELQINPFTSTPFQLSNSGPSSALISGIKYRHFTSPTMALRLVANIYYSRNSVLTQEGANGNPELRNISSQFDFMVRPGIEKHWAGSRRVSPYAGAEVFVGYRYTRLNAQSDDNGSAVDNIYTNGYAPDQGTSTQPAGGLTIGLNGLAGVDVYLARGFYLGTELGYGISYFTASDQKYTPNTGESVTRPGGENNLLLTPYVQSSIRVGFNF